MTKHKTPLELGRRERQIVETVTRIGESTVAQVLEQLADPPSYSSVRKMLGILVEKKWLKVRQDGKRYLYRLAADGETSRRRAITRLLRDFFSGSASEALASLLDTTNDRLTEDELQKMNELIKQATRNIQ
ncbi:MAG: BlaI/MecI/CopY family transcriptional regulator [Pirellulaceae bacterium]